MSSTCSSIGDRSIDDAEVVHILCSRESSGWDSDEDDTTKLAIGEVLSNTPDAPLFSSSPVAFAAKAAALFRVDLSSNSFIDDEDLLEVIAATTKCVQFGVGKLHTRDPSRCNTGPVQQRCDCIEFHEEPSALGDRRLRYLG